MYYSAAYLDEFMRRTRSTASAITDDLEFVLVNDGSPDDSLDIAIAYHKKHDDVRVVDLSRNFGHHRAMMVGLAHVTGDLIFLIDCDLEEPPEALSQLYEALNSNGADVAYGVQTIRDEPLFNKVTANLYYTIFNMLSDQPIPRNVLTLRLMSSRYVRQLVRHQERVFSIEGLWQLTGFQQVPVYVSKAPHSGNSTYTLRRKIAMAASAVTAFSNKPLIYMPLIGFAIMGVASLGIAYLLIVWLAAGASVEGWASLILSIWFVGGLTIVMLGVIAIYLAVIFNEVKARPYYIIREIYDQNHPDDLVAPLSTESALQSEQS
jgi:putative glycosyltransferase